MSNARKKVLANQIKKDVFYLISFAAICPTIIMGIFFYFLIYKLTSYSSWPQGVLSYFFIPMTQRIMDVLMVTLPIVIVTILIFAFKLTHRTFGPYERIIREMGDCIEGKKSDYIIIRQKDRLWPLVDKVNMFIKKMKEAD